MDRPSRTNLLHLGVMAAALVFSLAVVAVAARPLASNVTGDPQRASGAEGAKVPEIDVTLTGTVGTRTTADGSTEYTLTSDGNVLTLDAGPAWFFTNGYPLAPYVGKQVTIGGAQRQGSTNVDVLTVDGTALREPGKPPWAGGWKTVGERHPGWSQEKADRQAAKQAEKMQRFGLDCWPPGHCKDKSARDVNPGSSATP